MGKETLITGMSLSAGRIILICSNISGVLPKRNYSDLMAYVGKEFKDGDLIATADIQSHLMAFSHIVRHYNQYHYDPSEMFCFLSYPILLHPFDVQYLQIGDLVGNLSLEGWEKLHTFSFFQGGGVKMGKIQLDAENFKRIWLISSKWGTGIPFSISPTTTRA